MFTLHQFSYVQCKPRPVADEYTQNTRLFNAGSGTPRTMKIALPAAPSGLTIAVYMRKESANMANSTQNLAGLTPGQWVLNGQSRTGCEAWGNGNSAGGPYTRMTVAAGWVLWVIRPTAASLNAGTLNFNGNNGSTELIPYMRYADVRIWFRRLTDAEILSPTLPEDNFGHYRFTSSTAAPSDLKGNMPTATFSLVP